MSSRLSIGVIEARGLMAKDRSGTSDPFIELRLLIDGKKEEPKYSTIVVENTLDPVFKERFVFIHEKLLNPAVSAVIVLKCFDQNRFGARDFEGIVEINVHDALKGVNPGNVVESWLPFQPYKGDIDVSGDLHVQLAWGDLPLEDMEHAAVLSPAEQARLQHKKQLELQQMRKLDDASTGQQALDMVKNLTSVGSFTPVSDASRALRNLTRSIAPVLGKVPEKKAEEDDDALSEEEEDDDEEHAMPRDVYHPLYFYASQVLSQPLNAEPFDDLDTLSEEVSTSLDVSRLGKMASALQRPRSTKALLNNLLFRFYTLEQHPVYSKSEWSHKSQYFAHLERQRDALRAVARSLVFPVDNFKAKLIVKVLEAHDLPPCDSNGLSDPYVVLQVGSDSTKTKTINRTLNPKWKKARHTLRVSSAKDQLTATVWDWDATSEDDFMGSVVIPIASLEHGNEENKWYKLQTGQGTLHMSVQLKYAYAEHWRAFDDDSELPGIGLAGLLDGELDKLPSSIDLAIDHTIRVAQLLDRLLVKTTNGVQSLSTDEAQHKRVQWLIDAYGDRFGVPLARRRVELLRLLVRAGNDNVFPTSGESDPFRVPGLDKADELENATSSAASDTQKADSAKHICQHEADSMALFMAEAGSLKSVKDRPSEVHVALVHETLCVVRRQVAPTLLALSSHDLIWDEAMRAQLEPQSKLEETQKERTPLQRDELDLMRHIQEGLALQRLAVLRQFKQFYNMQDAPVGALAANVDTLEELLHHSSDVRVILRAAVLESTRAYHASLAPDSLLTSVEGMMALHTALEEEMEEDRGYERSFPSTLGYTDLVTQHYLAEHARAFTRFVEECEYSPGVFRVYAEANALRAKMMDMLSDRKAREQVATLDTIQLYTPFVFGWLKATRSRLLRWSANAIKIDTREPVHEEVCYSVGIVDVFTACQSAYQFLVDAELTTPFVNTQFAEVVCDVIRRYVEVESAAFCEMVSTIDAGRAEDEEVKAKKKAAREKRRNFEDDDTDEESDSFRENASEKLHELLSSSVHHRVERPRPFVPTAELCVSLCNVEEARFKLDELLELFGESVTVRARRASVRAAAGDAVHEVPDVAKQLDEQAQATQAIWAEAFEALSIDTFTYLSNQRNQLLGLLMRRLHRFPAFLIGQLEHNKEATPKPILDYFDEQWGTMAVWLRGATFQSYLQGAWVSLMDSLKDRLLEVNPQIDEGYVDNMLEHFHGGGEGLKKQWMLAKTDGVRRLIKYNQLTTRQLIKFYWSQKRAMAETMGQAGGQNNGPSMEAVELMTDNIGFASVILRARCKSRGDAEDEEARAFVKELDQIEKKERAIGKQVGGNAALHAAAAAAVAAHDQGQLDLTPGVTTHEERVRARFLLPSSETLIEDFTCRSVTAGGNLGKMHLTTSHLCYEVRWGEDDASAKTELIDIEQIVSMRAEKGWIGGSLFVTHFSTDGVAREVEFDRFPSVNKCHSMILERAMALGHTIEKTDN